MTNPGARRWRLVRATPTSIPASVRRFNARARDRRIRSARPWFVAAALVALVGLLSWLFYGTSVLGVAHIKVIGAGFVSAAEIRSAAGVSTGTPLASVDTGAVASRVQRLAGVAHAVASRDWPSTLDIDVTLRTAVAAIPRGTAATGGNANGGTGNGTGGTGNGGTGGNGTGGSSTGGNGGAGNGGAAGSAGYLLVDATGVPFRTVPTVPDGVMVIELTNPGPADPSTQGALAVLAALPPALRDQVQRMTAAAPAEIQLLLDGARVIIWGDSTDSGTKARVALSLLRNPGKVIDVSAPNLVTVR